jgi:cytochrome P450
VVATGAVFVVVGINAYPSYVHRSNKIKAIIYNVACGLYSVYFHPLSKFPGPKLAAASRIYQVFYTIRGHRHKLYAALHEKYGEVVRVGPKSLSFINEKAWRDIYMTRPQMRKVMKSRTVNGAHSIISAPGDVHARQRKVLAHAFSEKAVSNPIPSITRSSDIYNPTAP